MEPLSESTLTRIIRITAYFDDMPPIEQIFELYWSGKYSDDYSFILKKIRIKKKI